MEVRVFIGAAAPPFLLLLVLSPTTYGILFAGCQISLWVGDTPTRG
jgi:hypothetical protein